MNDYFIVPGSKDAEGFVELARSQKGRLFRKQILKMNESFTHPGAPGKTITVDPVFAKRMQDNFREGICDIVQVPIVNDANQHVEDPTRNIGEVVDLTYDEKGVYATIDARKHAEDLGSTLLGASALMHLDYADTATGEKKGPTLLHVAVTNRPYITNLGDFEEVIAASASGLADTSGETPGVLIPAQNNTEEETMDLDQILATLKDEHGIDVPDLQEKVAALSAAAETGTEGAEETESELLAALSGVLAPGADTLTIKDVADAVLELHNERVELSGKVASLAEHNEAMLQKAAEAEVDALISEGRVLPKQRDTMIALSRNDRAAFDSLVPDTAIVALSEDGVTTFDAPEQSEEMEKNIERLVALANGSK
jgi:hypothetical protein